MMKKSTRAVSLTLNHFSILTEQTAYGPRSFAMTPSQRVPLTYVEPYRMVSAA